MLGLGNQQVPKPPPTVPTDRILPLNAADDTAVLRSVVVVLSYRFDDVLDPERLKSSYEKLLDRPGWRKIGARLRLNVGCYDGLLYKHRLLTDFSRTSLVVSSITSQKSTMRIDPLSIGPMFRIICRSWSTR